MPLRFVTPIVAPGYEGFAVAILSGLVGAAALAVWWLAFSRASRKDRAFVALLSATLLVLVLQLNHESMRFMWCAYFALPLIAVALLASLLSATKTPTRFDRKVYLIVLLVALGPWPLVRLEGLTGAHRFQFASRWSAQDHVQESLTGGLQAARVTEIPRTGWSGFRGPRRDGRIDGLEIGADWVARPPRLLWRRTLGDGWSSFAVQEDLAFTLAQDGDDEVVVALDIATGVTRWEHRDTTRFFEAMGGPGPRSTPAVSGSLLVTLGATGRLNAFTPSTGSLLWSRDLEADADAKLPVWGFAASPLILGDQIVVAASGRLLAYSREGEPIWTGRDRGASYSSPHRLVLGETEQVLHLNAFGATAVDPRDGRELWSYAWSGQAIVQPAVIGDDVIVSAGEGRGLRRLNIARQSAEWIPTEVWSSGRLRPNFSDFVVHQGVIFGFDGSILAALDGGTGDRLWKRGRYGHGQLLLLSEQGLLLVVTERGELALVAAEGDGFRELARLPVLGTKSWNHPALVGRTLLIRGGDQVAALDLPARGNDVSSHLPGAGIQFERQLCQDVQPVAVEDVEVLEPHGPTCFRIVETRLQRQDVSYLQETRGCGLATSWTEDRQFVKLVPDTVS